MIDYVATFIFFFAVIDPIGTVPVFIAVTSPSRPRWFRPVSFFSLLRPGS
jgi:multiple antibiotic resistance protein